MNTSPQLSPFETLSLAVDLCDSQADFARRVGVSPQAVRNWIKRDRRVPIGACPFIERAVGDPRVICETLRPDYQGWAVLRQQLLRGDANLHQRNEVTA
ncbi:transcriptional regulator [Burkholderia pseudomallei]|uniref:transcriptional regulator n=1 Tax=Burkholderia pseudomallei TaxID=28450 RepID=UPI001924EE60|nr:YdaS family helix-turn-helix protein [Burkholderia pseudomallei]